ncbi:MAG: TlpA family protein disulfide reductase [Weeksellaceae bacterium]
MKRLIILIVLFCAGVGYAQFNIEGKITGYENAPIHIKMFEEGSSRLLKRVNTNDHGEFHYKFPIEYTGIITFELNNGSFEIVSDNKNISFNTNLKDPNLTFDYSSGINQTLNKYNEIQQLQGLRDNTLMPLLSFYRQGDVFYENLLDEISRINDIEIPVINSEPINYYLKTKEELKELSSAADASQAALKAKLHLVNDDENLENFGFLTPMLSVYISNSLGAAKSREEATEKIGSALDTLLEEAVAETPRGQHILSNAISMLEGNGFTALSAKYVEQANSMTCEKTGDLKDLLEVQNNIKVGKKAPNFDLKGTRAKSLYKVKADKKLVIFWASWCPHCLNEMPFVQEFYKDFKKNDGEIIAISLDMDKKAFEEATKDFDWINYSDFLKWDSPIVVQYGVNATPTMFMLDKDNKIIQIGSRVSEFKQ